MALTWVPPTYDADLAKYVTGVKDASGNGFVHITSSAMDANRAWSLAVEELQRQNLPITDLTPATTMTLAGIIYGTPGASAGDTIDFVIVTPDGSTDTYTYTYTLGDTLADVAAFLEASADDLEANAMTFSVASGKLKGVADVAGATLPALSATFVDVGPGETTATLGTWTTAAKATKVLTASGNPADNDTVTIGAKVYRFKDTLAQANDVKIDAATQATATLTLTGQPSDTNTLAVNDQVYVFQTVLVDVANNILIGGTTQETIDNLLAALSGGLGAGTTYGTGTSAPTDVTAMQGDGTSVVFTATTPGTGGNAYASTGTMANASFGGATFSGGTAATASDTLDNLIAAVTAGAGSGTAYHAGTTINASATAAAGAGDTVDVTALIAGTAGNAIAIAESSTALSWAGGAVFLSGGADVLGSQTFTVATVTATGSATLDSLDQMVGDPLDPPVS